MRTLNYLRKPKFASILAFLVLFVSCNQYDNTPYNLPEENSIIDFDTALKNFKVTYKLVKPKIKEIEEYRAKNKQSKSVNSKLKLAFEPLIKPSLDLFKSANFSEKDLIEMLGEKYDNSINTAAIGIMFYELNNDINKNSKNLASKHVSPVRECFLDVTGIAAGVALVGALVGQAGGKKVRKAFMRLIKKIGVKTAAGIGLAIMAAEFAYCVYTSDES